MQSSLAGVRGTLAAIRSCGVSRGLNRSHTATLSQAFGLRRRFRETGHVSAGDLLTTAAMATSGPAAGKKMVLVVAVALIDQQQRVLLAQRPEGKAMAGLWEFPGGKVDAGETPEAALCRELQEELSIQVQQRDLQPLTFASHTYDTFHLLMPLYVCRAWCGEPHGAEGQQLAWVAARQLRDYAMPAADIPLVPPVLAAMAGSTPAAS